MEQNPSFDDMDVTERPESTVKSGKTTQVVKGTRQELFDLDDDAELDYGELDDVLIRIEGVVEHEGAKIEVDDTIRFYDEPTSQTALGRFKKRYDSWPEADLDVEWNFDENGQAQIVGLRG